MQEKLPCFSSVVLLEPAQGMYASFPKGTKGCIVDVYDSFYFVEVFNPSPDVVLVAPGKVRLLDKN